MAVAVAKMAVMSKLCTQPPAMLAKPSAPVDVQLMMRSSPQLLAKLLQAQSRRGTENGRPADMPHLSLRGTDAHTDAGRREDAQAAAAITRLQQRFHPADTGAAADPRGHVRTSSLAGPPTNASLIKSSLNGFVAESPLNATAAPEEPPITGQDHGERDRVQAAIHAYRHGVGDDHSPAAKELEEADRIATKPDTIQDAEDALRKAREKAKKERVARNKKRAAEWEKEGEHLPEKPEAFDMPKGQTWNGIGAFRPEAFDMPKGQTWNGIGAFRAQTP
ncbi:hypothetical protein T484DRAFT_1780578 [Baffinella frigidus]|nr:hypothetical protein T484DRAFT_1780578 [Cryptophyta sp. CCMP2293]